MSLEEENRMGVTLGKIKYHFKTFGLRRLIVESTGYAASITGTFLRCTLSGKPSTPEQAYDYLASPKARSIRPMQVKSEILGLANLVRDLKPQVIMEIGTAAGGTLYLWSRLAPDDAMLLSLDLPAGLFGGGYPGWKKLLYKSFRRRKQTLKLIRADSHAAETRAEIERLLNGKKIDFLFVDGDHTFEGVAKDVEMYSPLVRSGGLMAFHDIAYATADSRVDEYWRQVRPNYAETWEFIEQNPRGFGIGVVRIP